MTFKITYIHRWDEYDSDETEWIISNKKALIDAFKQCLLEFERNHSGNSISISLEESGLDWYLIYSSDELKMILAMLEQE